MIIPLSQVSSIYSKADHDARQESTNMPPSTADNSSKWSSVGSNEKEQELRVQYSVGSDSFNEHVVAQHHDYKTMNWLQAGLVMIAETISLGICALPRSMATLGLLPGSILIIGLGLMAWYTGYIVYQFKRRYPAVKSYPEAGQIIAGNFGRWVAEVMSVLQLVFIAAAHVLTFTMVLNVLTDHGACTIIWGVVGAIICFICTVPRTLRGQSWLSLASCTSIITAVIVAMVAIGIEKPDFHDFYLVAPSKYSSFADGAGAVCSIVIAFTGHVAYPNIIDEMKHEEDFPKSLAFLGCSTIIFYLSVAVVIYVFGGSNMPSPAFGKAYPIIQKICWGIAIPTVIVAGVIAAIICAKRIFDLYWQHRKQPQVIYEPSKRAWFSWLFILVVLWFVAWLIASVVPVFHQLLTIIGAAFAVQFCSAFNSIMWLFLQWQASEESSKRDKMLYSMRNGYFINWQKGSLTILNVLILVTSLVVTVVGLYSAGHDISRNGEIGKPFSCKNNVPGTS